MRRAKLNEDDLIPNSCPRPAKHPLAISSATTPLEATRWSTRRLVSSRLSVPSQSFHLSLTAHASASFGSYAQREAVLSLAGVTTLNLYRFLFKRVKGFNLGSFRDLQ